MTYRELIKKSEKLALSNQKEAEAVRLLLLELSNLDNNKLYINLDNEVPKDLHDKFDKCLNQYIFDNIPVQHLIGYSYFYGYKFIVNDDVLIPRNETEGLVEFVLYFYDEYFGSENTKIIDLGCGSGCIGITLDLETNKSDVTLVDISEKALNVARQNANNLKSNVKLIKGSWFENISGRFDIIVANPPYIPDHEYVDEIVRKEPSIALFGGKDGIDYYDEILKNALKHANKKCLIAFEHGYMQNELICKTIEKYIKECIIVQKKDLSGKNRYTFIGIGGVLNEER